jgi:hypothetical protein
MRHAAANLTADVVADEMPCNYANHRRLVVADHYDLSGQQYAPPPRPAHAALVRQHGEESDPICALEWFTVGMTTSGQRNHRLSNGGGRT